MTLLTSAQSAVVGDIAGQTFAGAKYATQVSSWRTDATKRVMLVHWVAEQRPCGAPSAARVSVATGSRRTRKTFHVERVIQLARFAREGARSAYGVAYMAGFRPSQLFPRT